MCGLLPADFILLSDATHDWSASVPLAVSAKAREKCSAGFQAEAKPGRFSRRGDACAPVFLLILPKHGTANA